MKACDWVATDEHALQCELAVEVLHSSGTLRLGVRGWSMFPALLPGDTLIIEQTDSGAICPGDIVLFGRDGRFVVHRVVAKMAVEQSIQTRGDAMPRKDPPVSDRELLGKVVSIVRNGKCLKPRSKLNFASRSVATLLGHSETAARALVAVHGMLQSS